jgi:drug/metabolite transporter (DMT)-like permease
MNEQSPPPVSTPADSTPAVSAPALSFVDAARRGWSFFFPTSPTRSHAVWLLVMTAVLWSTGGALIKLIQWNAPAIAGARSAIAAVLMMLFYRSLRFRVTWLTVAAAVAYAATVMLFVSATKLTTAANAILLQYTAPVFVALFASWFLGERTRWYDWITIVVVLGGMYLFFLDGLTVVNIFGNAIAIMSGIAFAWFILLMRKYSLAAPPSAKLEAASEASPESQLPDALIHAKQARQAALRHALQPVILGNVLTALIGLPFAKETYGGVSVVSWVGVVLLGVLQLGFSYVLYVQAIRSVSAMEAVLVPAIEPLLNPVWAWMLVGERPGSWALVGGAVVIGAVTLRSLWMVRSERVTAAAAAAAAES